MQQPYRPHKTVDSTSWTTSLFNEGWSGRYVILNSSQSLIGRAVMTFLIKMCKDSFPFECNGAENRSIIIYHVFVASFDRGHSNIYIYAKRAAPKNPRFCTVRTDVYFLCKIGFH